MIYERGCGVLRNPPPFPPRTTPRTPTAQFRKSTPLSSLIVDKRGKMFTSSRARSQPKTHPRPHSRARDVSLLEHVADKFTGVSATMVQREKFSILRTNRFSAVIGEDCLHLFEKDSASSRAVAQKVSSLMKTILQEEQQQQQQQQQQRSYYYSFRNSPRKRVWMKADAVGAEAAKVRFARRRGDETAEEQ